MKIIVKHNGSEIIIDEGESSPKEKLSTIQYSDQNKLIQDMLKVMVEQLRVLTTSDNPIILP